MGTDAKKYADVTAKSGDDRVLTHRRLSIKAERHKTAKAVARGKHASLVGSDCANTAVLVSKGNILIQKMTELCVVSTLCPSAIEPHKNEEQFDGGL